MSTVFEALGRLAAAAFKPATILDGGAHVGNFARPAARIFPDADVLLIDPLEDVHAALTELATLQHWQFAPVALGAEAAPAVAFYKSGLQSSLLKSYTGDAWGEPDSVAQMALNDLVVLYKTKEPYLLKLDIQGGELAALEGAYEMLPKTPVIITEVNFVRWQSAMPLFDRVASLLFQCGYLLYDLTDEGRRRDGSLRQANAIFVQASAELVNHQWEPGLQMPWSGKG